MSLPKEDIATKMNFITGALMELTRSVLHLWVQSITLAQKFLRTVTYAVLTNTLKFNLTKNGKNSALEIRD
jgi:hypothetical protein